MASKSSIDRLLCEDAVPGVVAIASDALGRYGLPRSTRYQRPLAVALIALLHCASVHAADVVRDTPAASMALATGLYAAPGQSAAVSTVATPTVAASPLPPEAPPPRAPEVASPVSVVAAVPIGKTPETTGWTNYVAVIASLVGAVAGIAGMIMGGVALRRVSRRRRY